MRSDGSNLQRLTYDSSSEKCPAISPDGTRIAFSSNRHGTYDLFVMDLEGGNVQRLTDSAEDELMPEWAPDGSKIAFYRGPAGGLGHIFVMSADGTNVQQITAGPWSDERPDWSPDGTRILFASSRGTYFEIYSVKPDGSDVRRITSGAWDKLFPDGSPDGARIAYVAYDFALNVASVHVVNADGSRDTALTNRAGIDQDPQWSPDGTRIVFPSNRDGGLELYTMKADGTDLQRVTWTGSDNEWPTWHRVGLDAGIEVAGVAVGHDVHLHWNASPWPGVLRYDIYRGATPQEQAPTLAGSTSDTTFTDLGRFGTFYYRLRAVRAADQSLFSNEDTLTACVRTASFFPANSGALTPLTGDFNADGLPDLALANSFTSGFVSILRGTGGGSFLAPLTYPAGATPSALVSADFDDDGISDLAVANNATSGTFSLLRGLAGGAFAAPVSYPVGSRPSALAAADFDEDGITDLAVACRSSNAVYVARGLGADGTGNGSFAPAVSYPTAALPVALATADFDHDGITDLAVVGNSSGEVSLLRGNGSSGHGDGTFAPAVTCFAGTGATALATGDFDEDGATDLAVALNTTSGGVALLRGLGDGSFATAVHYPAGAAPVAIAVTDFTGDGVADLLLANRSGNVVSCLPGSSSGGHGDGTFGAPIAFATAAYPSGLALGDFNLDGLPDLAVSHSTGTNTLVLLPEVCAAGVPHGLSLLSPAGGESWPVGTEQLVRWTKERGVGAVDLEVSRDGGTRWESLARDLTGSQFTWTVTGPLTTAARLRVHDPAVPSRSAQSAGSFTIATNVAVPPAATVPGELRLEGACPSPARGPWSVAFSLPDDAPATLELLDLAGRRLASRPVGALGPGRHVVELLGPQAHASGVCFLRLRHGTHQLVTRAVLLN
jgi:TolB protein